MYESQKEAKANGWYSRRHATRAEQDAARELYQQNHGKAARRRRAEERRVARLLELDIERT